MTMNQLSLGTCRRSATATAAAGPRRVSVTVCRQLLATVCCCAWWIGGIRCGIAQEIRLDPLPPVADQNQPVDAVRRKIEQLIETTEQARRLRADEPFSAASPAGDAASRPLASPGGSSSQTSSDEPDTVQQINEIRDRLRILQRFRRDEAISRRAEAAAAKVPAWEPPATTEEIKPKAKPDDSLDEQVAEALKADQPAADDQDDSEAAEPQAVESISGQRLLSDAVDSFALGESLYRTGNYKSALAALQKADTSGMSPSERTWMDLMIALCQRRLGTYDKAEGALREIANAKSSDYPVQVAKWWLKYAEADYESKTRLEALETEIELLLERSRSHVPSQ
jgi:tetratricopeptide (TPR) repeat protein